MPNAYRNSHVEEVVEVFKKPPNKPLPLLAHRWWWWVVVGDDS